MMKRIAVGVWRWARATSPGRRSWTAAISVFVVAQRWLTRRGGYATISGRYRGGLVNLGAWRWPAFAVLSAFILLITVVYRSEFVNGVQLPAIPPGIRAHKGLVIRALLATAIMLLLFFAGQPPAKAAIVVGGLLLLTRRLKSQRIYAEIDWSLLLMFAGLFIIVAGAQHTLLTPDIIDR